MHYAIFDTAWGDFGLAAHDKRLVATFLPRTRQEIIRTIRASWPHATEAIALFPRLQRAIADYFEGKRVRFSMEVDLSHLPPFHQSALAACRRIPYGQTASYADLARAAGKPNAARAVGGALARNPLPLVIPCHRVLHADGTIGGFSSSQGINEKTGLLRLEGVETDGKRYGVAVGTARAGLLRPLQGILEKARSALG